MFELKQAKIKSHVLNKSIVGGSDAIEGRTCQNWFARFQDDDFQLEDKEEKERTVRPNLIEEDDLKALIEEDPRQSTRY